MGVPEKALPASRSLPSPSSSPTPGTGASNSPEFPARYAGNDWIWRRVSRVVVGAIRSPAIPIGPGTQRASFSSSTERPPSSCSEIRKIFPNSVR
jgi:hypothetical protein